MTRSEIFNTLNEVFWDVFDDDTIRLNDATTSADVDGWDSLIHITLISAVEDAFDIKFEMKEIVGMKNIGEMVDVIEREV